MKRNYVINAFVAILFSISVFVIFLMENNIVFIETIGIGKGVKTVMIDPGHGGKDGGAVGLLDTIEKDINLDISKKLELVLNLFGINTKLTRRSDVSLSEDMETGQFSKSSDMRARVEMVRNTPDCTLISIHQNSFPEESCHGAQVFFSANNSYSKALAKEVQSALKHGVDPENRRKEKISDKTIYILNNTSCPSILVECGFLTNGTDAKLLKSDAHQTKLATCITAGYLRYENMK